MQQESSCLQQFTECFPLAVVVNAARFNFFHALKWGHLESEAGATGTDGYVSSSSVSVAWLQVPFYRGERITFDVAPSRMNFKVEHNSLKLEVKFHSYCSFPVLQIFHIMEGVNMMTMSAAHLPRDGLLRHGPSPERRGRRGGS